MIFPFFAPMISTKPLGTARFQNEYISLAMNISRSILDLDSIWPGVRNCVRLHSFSSANGVRNGTWVAILKPSAVNDPPGAFGGPPGAPLGPSGEIA